MFELFIILVFYLISSMMIIGYGQFAKILFLNNKSNFKEIGIIGLFGFLILYNISYFEEKKIIIILYFNYQIYYLLLNNKIEL